MDGFLMENPIEMDELGVPLFQEPMPFLASDCKSERLQ